MATKKTLIREPWGIRIRLVFANHSYGLKTAGRTLLELLGWGDLLVEVLYALWRFSYIVTDTKSRELKGIMKSLAVFAAKAMNCLIGPYLRIKRPQRRKGLGKSA